jgi:hypothetical protein
VTHELRIARRDWWIRRRGDWRTALETERDDRCSRGRPGGIRTHDQWIKRLARQETASTCLPESGWSTEQQQLPDQSSQHLTEAADHWILKNLSDGQQADSPQRPRQGPVPLGQVGPPGIDVGQGQCPLRLVRPAREDTRFPGACGASADVYLNDANAHVRQHELSTFLEYFQGNVRQFPLTVICGCAVPPLVAAPWRRARRRPGG